MATAETFYGVYPMLYTYFDADGRIDLPAMRRQVDACIDAGAHGIAILGIVGEFYKLNCIERRAVLDCVAESVAGRVPLAVTIPEPSIPGQIELAAAAAAAGAQWVILQPPAVRGIPESELLRFLGAVADRCELPVAIQNNPVNLEVWLSNAGLKTLNERHPNVTLLKGEGPVTAVRRTIEETDGRYRVFCGLAGKELPASLEAGCIGCVPAPDCVDWQVRIYELSMRGDAASMTEAQRLHREIFPLLAFLTHSPEHLLCYGKRLFALRAGIARVHPRAPCLYPDDFGTRVAADLARDLPFLSGGEALLERT